jgi:signal transduction histidine kinase
MKHAPIRARLTAWYVLALALVLVALGAFVVTRLRSDLTSELDRGLRSAAGQIALGYGLEGPQEFRDVTPTVLPGPRGHGSGAQIVQRSGHVRYATGDAVTRMRLVSRATLADALQGDRVVVSRHVGPGNEHLRLIAMPAQFRDGRREVLVVAESLKDIDSSVHKVLVLLLVGGIAALALLAGGGWWIARKALQPVERMTTRADLIGIADLSQRIAVPRAEDEVGHLARTLNAMLDRLEEGVHARERLVADASHELRAPLAAMRSELEVSMRQDELGAPARAVLASARDEVIRMSRVVDNLLALARVDAGRLELLVSPQDLADLAERVVHAHRAAAEAAGATVVVEGTADPVAADPDRVEQVLGNLVDNAIRFSPPGGQVTVGVWQNGHESGFTISDGGPGVPDEARERVFDRFSREDNARGRSGGAGLGLAIALEIVSAHGGRIWVEGRDPHGSAFVVALPRGPVAARRPAGAGTSMT